MFLVFYLLVMITGSTVTGYSNRNMSYLIFFSVANPGSSALLTPGSGCGIQDEKKILILDELSGSYFRELSNIFLGSKTYILLCGSGIRDLFYPVSGFGMEKFGSEMQDKHPGSATLMFYYSLL